MSAVHPQLNFENRMNKKLGCLAVLVVSGLVGSFLSSREESRRAALTPEQRAAEDSAFAAREKARMDSVQAERERTPVYHESLAEFALKQRMKDPESAKFRNETVHQKGDTIAVCGEVNSKNSLGGYTGFKVFVSVRGAVVTEEDIPAIGEKVFRRLLSLCEAPQMTR